MRIDPGIPQIGAPLVRPVALDVAQLGALLEDPFVASLTLQAFAQRVADRKQVFDIADQVFELTLEKGRADQSLTVCDLASRTLQTLRTRSASECMP